MPIVIDTRKVESALKRLSEVPRRTREEILDTYGMELRDSKSDSAREEVGDELAQSFDYAADAERAIVGSPLVYSRIHHYGGTIYPSGSPNYTAPEEPLESKAGSTSEVTGKPIQHLTIPINAKKNTRARDYQDTFVFKSKKGHLLLAQKKVGGQFRSSRAGWGGDSGSGNLRILFYLAEKVEIKATNYAEITKDDEQTFLDIIKEGLQGLLTRR